MSIIASMTKINIHQHIFTTNNNNIYSLNTISQFQIQI